MNAYESFMLEQKSIFHQVYNNVEEAAPESARDCPPKKALKVAGKPPIVRVKRVKRKSSSRTPDDSFEEDAELVKEMEAVAEMDEEMSSEEESFDDVQDLIKDASSRKYRSMFDRNVFPMLPFQEFIEKVNAPLGESKKKKNLRSQTTPQFVLDDLAEIARNSEIEKKKFEDYQATKAMSKKYRRSRVNFPQIY